MKRVLIVTSGILPVPALRGGAVEYLTQLYVDRNESKQRFEFDVATIGLKDDSRVHEKYKNTNYIVINEDTKRFKLSRLVRFVANKIQPFYYVDNAFSHELLKILKRSNKKYDLIMVENNPLYVKTLRKYDKRVKIILHLHNDYLNSKSKHHRYIFDNCDKIYTVSDYIRSRVCSIEENPKVSTIYNGIDVDRFDKEYTDKQRGQIRKMFGLKPDDFVVLFTGRLTEGKGILELLQAFREVSKKRDDLKLLVVGKGFIERKTTSRFERKLQRTAENLGDKVVFTGFVDYEKIPDIYKIADVSVTPSHWGEPLATTVIEGMASNTRQIVTNDGGIPEMVFDTDVCVIDKDNLIPELISSLNTCISDDAPKMSDNHAVAKERFDKERFIRDMLDIIGEVAHE